jgi:antitoxin component of MazEF toxin-antitoxin module
MEQIDRTNVSAFGGSLFVRLSAPVCKVMGIEKGTSMNVYKDGDKIVFEQVKK